MELRELADHHALRELISRYSRAIDRHDWAMLRDIYWPDATDDHGAFYRGPGRGFADAAARGLQVYERHTHTAANSLFVVEGDWAEGETYFLATAQTPPPHARHFQFGGRYLDRVERRDGVWGISHRHVVHDWLQVTALADETRALFEAMGTLGSTDSSDPSYTLAHHFANAAAARPPRG